ncbi:ABC transporter substrate-binding protein [Haloferax sp. ATB1]|uniref:ABC transporter substrate-binding protein n=1 Tax=Haloferax sp. ATB1 TaxID=1508454 RepID=UPI0009E216EC|nr:ABC transporter substrate-binding protein [Haloferax sp. ATB1]
MPVIDSEEQDSDTTVNRRRILQALGTTTVAGLAGCSGTGSNGGNTAGSNDELGERVPTQTLAYWTGLGGTTATLETMAPVVQKNLQDRLGVDVEVQGRELTAVLGSAMGDKREYDMILGTNAPDPSRLDPTEVLGMYEAGRAGAGNPGNIANYADCSYTEFSQQQRTTIDEAERADLIHSAIQQFSEDVGVIAISPRVIAGAWHPDQVSVGGHDSGAGMDPLNPYVYYESEATDGDTVVSNANAVMVSTTNFPTVASPRIHIIWSHLINSPLVEYDDSLELRNVLAEEYTASEDGTTITVTLHDDATFHNGDPVTAEDVRFTYKLLWDNADAYPQVTAMPYESIEAVDETTVEFNMKNPTPVLFTKVWPRWGILHKESWKPAMENPAEFSLDTDNIIGSGPFQVDSFRQGQMIQLSPYGDHPVFNPKSRQVMQVFQGSESVFRAFQNGQISMILMQGMDTITRIRDEMENAKTHTQDSYLGAQIWPQHSYGATKFLKFRQAAGAVLDRQQMIAQAQYGEVDPSLYPTIFRGSHPSLPSEDQLYKHTDDPAGNEERGRQLLREAGWGWDNNGRLHYPPDADLTPLWPQGESPSPEEYPCLQ